MTNLILLNGPPRCGKDSIANAICVKHPKYVHHKFAKVLKEATHRLYNCFVPHDFFEDCKDEPNLSFLGLTPRQAYINVSEQYFKPVHGLSIIGQLFVKDNLMESPTVISDSGFSDEVIPLLDYYDSVFLFHIEREGTDFSKDSRSYITLNDPKVRTYKCVNNGTVEQAVSTIINIVNQ